MVASFNYPDNALLFYLSFVLVFGSPLAAVACMIGHLRAIAGSDRLSRPLLILLILGSLVFGTLAVSTMLRAQGHPPARFQRTMLWLSIAAAAPLPISLVREWKK